MVTAPGSITSGTHTRSVKSVTDTLKRFAGERPGIQNLIDALSQGRADDVKKSVEDIFSGSTTDQKRNFEIIQAILSGAGGAYAENTASGAAHEEQEYEEEKRREHALDALIDELMDYDPDPFFYGALKPEDDDFDKKYAEIEKQAQTIENTLGEQAERVEQLEEAGHISTEDAKKFRTRIQELLTETDKKQAELEGEKKNYNKASKTFIETYEKLSPEEKKLIASLMDQRTRIVDIAHNVPGENFKPPLRNVVYKGEDKDGKPTYYVKNEKGERSEIPQNSAAYKTIESQIKDLGKKVGNDLNPGEADKYAQTIREFKKFCEENGNAGNYETVLEAINARQQARTKMAEIEKELLKIEQETLKLKEEIDSYDPKKLADLEQRQKIASKELAELHVQNEKAEDVLEGFIEALQKAEKEAKVASDEYEEIEKIMKDAPADRHAQIRDLYTKDMNWLEKQALKLPSVTVFAGAAKIYAAAFSDADIVKAWNNVIKTEKGEPVYRENTKEGRFYTYDERTGTRTEIKDPEDLKRIAIAYVKGQLVANESPLVGKDENNNFNTTHNQTLSKDEILEASKIRKEQKADVVRELRRFRDATNRSADDPASAQAAAETASAPMPAARHEDAGKLSQHFGTKATPEDTLEDTPLTPLRQTRILA
jgi:DNA repair exonuclease SbcCD ATPase subunit